jgi:hypothetical protein
MRRRADAKDRRSTTPPHQRDRVGGHERPARPLGKKQPVVVRLEDLTGDLVTVEQRETQAGAGHLPPA